MDHRPIGIFDSGIGGLSAVRALRLAAPQESVIYFGDTARVPYGDRNNAEILELSRQDARFLRKNNAKAILIACNTITALCLEQLVRENPDIPVCGTIQPASQTAAGATRNKHIGILATCATANDGAYTREISALLPDADVCTISCPKLVPLIEDGHLAPDDPAITETVAEYLQGLIVHGADTVVLGCTHYPLIKDSIRKCAGPHIVLVDSGQEAAGALLRVLHENSLLEDPEASGKIKLFCSGNSADFNRMALKLLPGSFPDTVQIDITRY